MPDSIDPGGIGKRVLLVGVMLFGGGQSAFASGRFYNPSWDTVMDTATVSLFSNRELFLLVSDCPGTG
jgi:hypothetical protein